MTSNQRDEMFAKDYLTIADVQELLGVKYGAAASIIRQIKFKHDRLGIQGKVHVQDYLDYYCLPSDRYQSALNAQQKERLR